MSGGAPGEVDLDGLILANLDGTATEEQLLLLRSALEDSEPAARRFIALSRVHADLGEVFCEVSEGEHALQGVCPVIIAAPVLRSRRITVRRMARWRPGARTGLVAAAAAVVIGAGLVFATGNLGGGTSAEPRRAAREAFEKGIAREPQRSFPAGASGSRAAPAEEARRADAGESVSAESVSHAPPEERPLSPAEDPARERDSEDDAPAPVEVEDAVAAAEPAFPAGNGTLGPPRAEEARPSAPDCGAVYQVEGRVLCRAPGGSAEPSVVRWGFGLREGSVLVSEHGRAKVLMRTGVRIYLDRHSELLIGDASGNAVSLLRGGLFVEVPAGTSVSGGAPGEQFVVSSPFCRVGHVGTSFSVTHRIATNVEVVEGIVEVANPAGRVSLGTMQAARVTSPDSAPRGPVSVAPRRFVWAEALGARPALLVCEGFERVQPGALPAGWVVDPGEGPRASRMKTWYVEGRPGERRLVVPRHLANGSFDTEIAFGPPVEGRSEIRALVRMDREAVRTGRNRTGDERWGFALFTCYRDTSSNYRLRFYRKPGLDGRPDGANQWLVFSKRVPREAPGESFDTLMPMGNQEILPRLEPGLWYHLAFRVTPREGGTLLEGKLWPGGSLEPGEWQLRHLDTDRPIRGGRFGLYWQRCGGEVDDVLVR